MAEVCLQGPLLEILSQCYAKIYVIDFLNSSQQLKQFLNPAI